MLLKLLHKSSRALVYLFLAFERPHQFFEILRLLPRNRTYLSELLRLHKAGWLQSAGVKTVLDVGAYTGSFVFAAHSVFPEARIYSFEPIPENFTRLQAQAARSHGKVTPFNTALGNTNGETTFHRNQYTASSSILPMTETHRKAFPETAHDSQITVPLQRLDEVEGITLESKVLLKIDVQGYDLEVLKGAQKTLEQVDFIIVETSVELLYEGQPSFDQIYDFLTARGFAFVGDFDQLLAPQDGRVLQIDAIFIRR